MQTRMRRTTTAAIGTTIAITVRDVFLFPAKRKKKGLRHLWIKDNMIELPYLQNLHILQVNLSRSLILSTVRWRKYLISVPSRYRVFFTLVSSIVVFSFWSSYVGYLSIWPLINKIVTNNIILLIFYLEN